MLKFLSQVSDEGVVLEKNQIPLNFAIVSKSFR